MTEQPNSRPNPDPTVLTTQAMQRELSALQTLMDSRFDSDEKERAQLWKMVDAFPTLIAKDGNAAQALNVEKFNSIALQFRELAIRTDQKSKDDKVAIDAALLAAKEAVSEQNKANAASNTKSEANFTNLIEQQRQTMLATTKSQDDKIDDLKTRVSEVGSRVTEISSRSSGGSDKVTQIGVAVALVLSFVTAVGAWVGHVGVQGGTSPPAAIATAPIDPSAMQRR